MAAIENVRAHVGIELSVEEMDTLIEMCGENGHFKLGLKLAEKKSRLASNVSRAKKDAEQIGAANGK
jgi:hypothetical protein